MDKYISLVEAIKKEYIGGLFRWNKDIDANIDADVHGFVINRNKNEIDKSTKIIEYNISEEESEKKWHFIVGPAMLLFANHMKKYREQLLESYSIQGVCTLKQGFFDTTMVPAAVILLDQADDNIWLSSAATSDDIIELFNNPSNANRKVYYTQKLDVGNFMPEHYNGELQELNSELDRHETRKLGDIADVIAGKSIPSRDWCKTGIPYLRGRDLKNGKIMKSDVFISEDDVPKCAKQLVQEGDILLSKNFGQHKIARVNEDDLPAIASNGLIIIRAFGVPEDYLYQYLTSETGKAIFDKQLSSIEKGATVASIGLKELVELRVPIFDQKTMLCFSSVDNIKGEDIVHTFSSMSRFMAYVQKLHPDIHLAEELEKYVYKSFLQSGWSTDELVVAGNEYAVKMGNNTTWCPDIVLLNDKQKLALVDVKVSLTSFTPEKLRVLYDIVHSGEYPFLIMTTGNYYEIHSANDKVIKKTTEAPTKEYLLSLCNGKEVQ